MENMREVIKARVPFTFSMNIDAELWVRFLDCVYDKRMSKVGAIREGIRLWLAENENNAA